MVLAVLAAAPGQAQPGRPLMVGAAEDAAKQGDPVAADAKMSLAQLAGFNTIRLTSVWWPGQTEIADGELVGLQNAADAAWLHGIHLIVSVYPSGSRVTPLTPTARDEFASYAASIPRLVPYVQHVIVGNEPNLNRFWMPQFTRNGQNAAAASYLGLLAMTYDRIKAVSPDVTVIGGSLSPRGGDNPKAARATHSPTRFILDLGAAYRRSGRTRPVMDWFSFHPYLESSRLPPTFAHPRSTTIALADYGKLVSLLGQAFDGTAQPGSTMPILYDEFGVQTKTDAEPAKALYTNSHLPSAVDAVDEGTQARYYRQALQLAACQANVMGLLFFHVTDEADLDRWQSGLYYADDTPKSSLPAVRDAADAARAGTLVPRC
ncbi:MAG TPA: hypothetical protein VJT84_08905 [Gaiellaceae bacterium]|nr:hypothetical protein [Gaiellaceae bacterium]